MTLLFTDHPGRRERHVRRRHGNILFARPPIEVEPETLLAAQQADHEEKEAFRTAFRDLVQEAAGLPPNADSDRVLGLKEELEKRYEQACGLPGKHGREQEALLRLIELIMKAVRQAAGNDPLAHQELDEAEQARAIHLRLLQHPLVADILHPDTPIGPDELLPTLLGAGPEELAAALEIFDTDQLALLAAQGRELLDGLDAHPESTDTRTPRERLALIEERLRTRTAWTTGGEPRPRGG